jgi:hypothetical protein
MQTKKTKGKKVMRAIEILALLPFYLFALLLFYSCGVDSDRFRIEGRLRNINQGEFWIYSIDGGIDGLDTIQVRDGRFAYETDMRTPSTLLLIFPNYSEQPVFAQPGKIVEIKGDASHLKEMTIKGTTANEEMTKLRMQLNKLMPPEIPKAVSTFIRENPKSVVGIYLLQHYFLMAPQPDYKEAYELATIMLEKQPDDGRLIKWQKELKSLQNSRQKDRLPTFSATDVKGRFVSQSDLNSEVNVIAVWASWNFNSTDMLYRLHKQKKNYGNRLSVVGICLDGRPADCRQRVDRDSLPWKTVCDGRMWDTPLLSTFGVADVPANLIIDNKGIIIERNLTTLKLEETVDKLLK